MKKSIRIIAIFTLFLMCIGLFAACAKDSDENAETTPLNNQTDETPNTDGLYDSNGFLKDSLPDGLNFNKTVRILYWSDVERPEFVFDQITGDNIGDAIIERNNRISTRLGVELEFIGEPGNNSNRASFVKRVQTTFASGMQEWDIVGTYSRTAGMMAVGGYFADLNLIEDSYIDTTKPWWPDSIIDTMGVGDALYYISGDASTNTLHFMYTIYYNKELINAYGLTDPTEFVLNKTWTLDKLIEMTSGVYEDKDNTGFVSEGDFYGFTTIYYGVDAFYTGSNLKLVERTGDENLIKISDDYYSEKAINLVDKLGKWLTTNDCYVSRSGDAVNFAVPFVNGNALFMQNRVYVADNLHGSGLNNVEWEYGLVPTPMYDLNQENYITVIGNPFTLYGIMVDCKDKTIMTAVIECWGSEAYRLTTPQLFEVNMKYRYVQDDIYVQMFDILRETSSFDQGRIFSDNLSYMSETPSKAATTGSSWATLMKSSQKVLNKAINGMVESFIKIQSTQGN